MKPVIAICFITSILVFSGCKKDKNPDPADTVKAQLQGTWRTTEFADDFNGNSTIDANEYYTDSNTYYIYTFSGNSVRFQTYMYDVKADITFQYSLSKDGKTIVFEGPSKGALFIDTLTNNRLILRDTSTGSGITWQILQKQ